MSVGKGIIAVINGQWNYIVEMNVFLRNIILLLMKGFNKTVNTYRSEGKVSIIIADKDHIIGIITLSDTMRRDDGRYDVCYLKLRYDNSITYGG